MTKKELLKALENIPDDFEIILSERIDDPVWPSYKTYKIIEEGDIGYSDKVIDFVIKED